MATEEAAPAGDVPPTDEEELRARLALLAAENRALRDAHARVRQTRYRRTAAGLAGLGVVAALAGLLFPDARTVLFALAATGFFAGLLTYYLTPERFIAASVGEATYDAHADAVCALVDELGLAGTRVYVPREAESDPARLFLPQHADYALPDPGDLEPLFVVTDDPDRRGVSLPPTGVPLFRELRRTLSGPLADRPGALAAQLADGLVEAFELAGRATPDVEAGDGRITVAIADSAYGGLDRPDHPVVSLLAIGLAVGLDRPVVVETAEDGRGAHLVTCRFEPTDEQEPVADERGQADSAPAEPD